MLTIQFLCPLPNGLHARPAWELKEQCSQWQSEVMFFNHRQNAKADAKSSLALIGTGTLFNDSCSLIITGHDEEQARRALEEYIQQRFIDSDSVQPGAAELAAHPLPRSLIRLNPDLLYGTVLAGGVGQVSSRCGRVIIWRAIARLRRVRKTTPGWSTVWLRWRSCSISNCASAMVRVKPFSARICL